MSNKTISYLYADMDRANQQGDKTLVVNLLDLKEVLALADSRVNLGKAAAAKRSAGFARAGSIHALKAGLTTSMRVMRKKSEQFSVELFFVDNLRGPNGEEVQS